MARSAVRRLADAAPAAEVAHEALELIERVGIGQHYKVAVAGDLEVRTDLLNCLAGQRLFDPARVAPARAAVGGVALAGVLVADVAFAWARDGARRTGGAARGGSGGRRAAHGPG